MNTAKVKALGDFPELLMQFCDDLIETREIFVANLHKIFHLCELIFVIELLSACGIEVDDPLDQEIEMRGDFAAEHIIAVRNPEEHLLLHVGVVKFVWFSVPNYLYHETLLFE